MIPDSIPFDASLHAEAAFEDFTDALDRAFRLWPEFYEALCTYEEEAIEWFRHELSEPVRSTSPRLLTFSEFRAMVLLCLN